MSQRDDRTLNGTFRKLNPTFRERPELRDHYEIDWAREYFQT
ncbi:hypothetical protein [Phenylobacterium glaciei]|nr:hypothetical protein [Phenylobacterium glaciei]